MEMEFEFEPGASPDLSEFVATTLNSQLLSLQYRLGSFSFPSRSIRLICSEMSTSEPHLISQQPFSAADFADDKKHHILLAASGSVATIKLPLIAQSLARHDNVTIRVVLTASAAEFLQGQSAEQPQLESLKQLPNVQAIYSDRDEWSKPWVRGDKILHIELRRWAHTLLIAPLSANSLAKMSNGLSDNLLTSVIRAWDTTGIIDGQKKMILVAPAMNSAMWRHPVTSKHIKTLKDEWGSQADGWVRVLGPVEKGLACGDVGDGGMMEWSKIVAEVETHLHLIKTS